MLKTLLQNPSPDFENFERVLKGEKKPKKVYFAEPWLNDEIIESITANLIGEKPVPPCLLMDPRKVKRSNAITVSSEGEKQYLQQFINFFYRMGYDFVPDTIALAFFMSVTVTEWRVAEDTAILPHSHGQRPWSKEGKGIITSWEDFEKFPWEKMKLEAEDYYKFLSENLPEGMKLTVCASLYQQIEEGVLGHQGLVYLLYDQPDLVEAVFNKWGEIIYQYYKSVIPLEYVGAILHGDDLGYKTALTCSPKTLRKLIFPWFKKYASLAHEYDKLFIYHCCGNALEVVEELIEDVGIDAWHSFQDVIIPVGKFKKRYGDKIGIMGGIDLDKLSRLNEEELRKYVRDTLDECMLGGRYALGSGNSITNYVPVKNYLAMIEEGLKWQG